MSKRFTDTEKFNDKWYRKLPLLQKVMWEYLLAECNHAGILEKFDIEMMSFKIGQEITKDDFSYFKDRIIFITDSVIFIPKFIQFQYGKLNPESKVHSSVIKELEKYSIDTLSIGLSKTMDSIKYKYIYKNNTINSTNNTNINKPKDIFCNQEFEKCFNIYKEVCTKLIPLRFERRSKAILEKLSLFLDEIDYNFDYFKELCTKANEIEKIADNKIDFKMLLNNHIGITNGKYKKEVAKFDY